MLCAVGPRGREEQPDSTAVASGRTMGNTGRNTISLDSRKKDLAAGACQSDATRNAGHFKVDPLNE